MELGTGAQHSSGDDARALHAGIDTILDPSYTIIAGTVGESTEVRDPLSPSRGENTYLC